MRLLLVLSLVLLVVSGAQACPIMHDIRGRTLVAPAHVFGDRLGLSVAAIGDFDGDGSVDFAASARRDIDAGHGQSIHVFSGASGVKIASFRSPTSGDAYGRHLVALGDVNGDGRTEFAATLTPIFNGESERGSVLVYSFGHAEPIASISGEIGEGFGESLASPGDLDGDGVSDLVVGAPEAGEYPGPSGAIRVFSGRTFQQIGSFVFPDEEVAFLGRSISPIGDIDGDGVGDVAAFKSYAGFSDYLLVLSGRALALGQAPVLAAVSGYLDGFDLGENIAPLGDVDGDGRNEFIWTIKDSRPEFPVKRIYIARLEVGALRILYAVDGDQDDYDFGTKGVVAIPDVDSDGRPDFVVSSGEFLYLISGAGGSTLYKESHDDNFVGLGYSLSLLGDVNGDGLPEVVIGNSTELRGQNLSGYNGSQTLQDPEAGVVLVRSVGLDSNGNGKPDACENSAGSTPNTHPGGGSGNPSGRLLVDQGLGQGNMVFTFRVQQGGQLVSLPPGCSYNLRMGATKRRKGSLKAPVVSIPVTGNPLTVSIGGGPALSKKSLGRKFLRYEAQLSCPGVAATQFKKASGRIRATTSRNGGLSISKWLAVVRDLLWRG